MPIPYKQLLGTLAEINASISDATLIDTADTRIPSQDENDSLAGTSGVPSVTNRYVTDADPRNSDARTPATHALGGAEHSPDTLANLNTKVSDATLIDTTDPRLSDDRTASALRTATTEVDVSAAAAPAAGQALVATSDTAAAWSTPSGDPPDPFTPTDGTWNVVGEISVKASGGAAGSEQYGDGANAGAVNTTSVGDGSRAASVSSTAVGQGATALLADTTALGQGALAQGARSTAIGKGTSVPTNASDSTVVGEGSSVASFTNNAVAVGASASARPSNTVAVGASSDASGDQSCAVGSGASASISALRGTALGRSANVGSSDTLALGALASATGNASTAVGENASVAGDSCTALGRSATTGVGLRGTALGANSLSGTNGLAAGESANASGNFSTALGKDSAANEDGGIALGESAAVIATHTNAVAIGKDSETTAAQRTTLGKVGGLATELQDLQISGGFAANGAAPQVAPSVTGSRAGNAALASLLTALDSIGLITDNTTA